MNRSHSRPSRSASARAARGAARIGLRAAIAAVACACLVPASGPQPAISAAARERVRVYYPPGACVGELEIELFDRASGAWRAHPEHPRLRPGACAWEEPGGLLNELRVRCVDPIGARGPSEWVVGAELATTHPDCAE